MSSSRRSVQYLVARPIVDNVPFLDKRLRGRARAQVSREVEQGKSGGWRIGKGRSKRFFVVAWLSVGKTARYCTMELNSSAHRIRTELKGKPH